MYVKSQYTTLFTNAYNIPTIYRLILRPLLFIYVTDIYFIRYASRVNRLRLLFFSREVQMSLRP